MADEYRQEASCRKEAVSMLTVSTIVFVVVLVVGPLINKGTPPPKFFVIGGVIYAIVVGIGIRGVVRGGRWLYQIADGRIRVRTPGEDEPSPDLAIEEVVGIHRRLGKSNQDYYLVDRSGAKHKIPEHNKMHAKLIAALRARVPDIEETRETGTHTGE